MADHFLLAFIIGCEIGFWVVLFMGLSARYIFNRRRLSNALLISVPLIDIALLIATTIDLSRGAVASVAHGLAAAYIGFSVAFGSVSISWADTWFANKFADGKPPKKPPTYGRELLRYEMVWWLRCVLAVAVTQLLVFLAIFYIDDAERSDQLKIWLTLPPVIAGLWFIFGPLWVALFCRSSPDTKKA